MPRAWKVVKSFIKFHSFNINSVDSKVYWFGKYMTEWKSLNNAELNMVNNKWIMFLFFCASFLVHQCNFLLCFKQSTEYEFMFLYNVSYSSTWTFWLCSGIKLLGDLIMLSLFAACFVLLNTYKKIYQVFLYQGFSLMSFF